MVVSLSSGTSANSGDDVVLDVVGVVGFCVGPDAGLGVDLVPHFHPRTDCVSPSFGYVQLLAFADRGLEFLLDLGLRFTQHVLDDPFSSSPGHSPRCSGPPSGRPFVFGCSPRRLLVFLAWYQPPFATNNTVTKGTKLPESRTVIRKLSFAHRSHAALSLSMAAQFLRCRRRSSLVTAVRFLNGQEALFIDYSGAKYARFTPKIAATLEITFSSG